MTTIAAGPMQPLPTPVPVDPSLPGLPTFPPNWHHEQPFRVFLSHLAEGRSELATARAAAGRIGQPEPRPTHPSQPATPLPSSMLANDHALASVRALQQALASDAPVAARDAVQNAIRDINASVAYLNIQDAPIQLPQVTSHFDSAKVWLDVAQAHASLVWAL